MNDNKEEDLKTLPWTGERYLPEIHGQIEIEHIHRYLFAKQLAFGKCILDIASGEGYGSAMLAEVAKSVVGVDISQDAVSHAIKKYRVDNLEFRLGSCSSIPVVDNSIDMIVSFETIEHHAEHDQMMCEFKRILSQDGFVIISSPNKYEYSDRTNYKNPYHVKELYRDEFEALLKVNFKNYKILDQKVVYGSALFGNDISEKFTSYKLSDSKISNAFLGLPEPIYLVAIASDGDLPIIQNGLLEANVWLSEPVKVKDEQINNLSHNINECYGQITSLSQDINERDEQINNLSQGISERDNQITNLSQDINKRDEQIANLDQDINERDAQITNLSQSVNERDAQITNLSQDINERDVQITNLSQGINERNEQIANLDQGVSERDTQIINLSQEINERDVQISSLDQAINEYDAQITNLSQQNQDINERDAQISTLNQAINERNMRIKGLENSRSWKITRPLRWCSHQMRRIAVLFELLPRAISVKGGVLPLAKNVIRVARKEGVAGLKMRVINVRLMNTRSSLSLNMPVHMEEELQSSEKGFDPSEIILKTSLQPVVSIIIPTYGKCNYTYKCLMSIAANQPSMPFEVIVIDDNSPDVSVEDFNKIKGIRFVSNSENQGFIRSCNLGAKLATGKYLYFLNNDTIVTAGWLDELVRAFHELPGTGLVGSKLIYPDGTLQEAGGIIWQDGSAWNFGRNQDPLLPVFNYAREVDYCSGASIMIPRALFEELGGFDEHYLPAYCEDADLALKIRDKGYRVIYQPLSTVIHYEGITSGTDIGSGVKGYQVENSKKLFERWRDRLKNHQPNGIDVDNAKDRCMKRRVLILEHCTPTPDCDAGSVTVFNFMLLLREMGFQITFIPEDNFCYMPEYTTALQRIGVEVLYAPYVTSVVGHVKEFGMRYDLVFLFRPVVAERHLDTISKYCGKAKILYYAHDLHFLRMEREADLFSDAAKQRAAEEMKARELKVISRCDASIIVTDVELEILKAYIPTNNVYVFPLILSTHNINKKFSDRKDIVFFGGYQHTPNVDAVHYFVEKIMPFLRVRLPGVCFHIVGSMVPDGIQALSAKDVIVVGFVEDLLPMLDKMRISVAPLRYGAGIKGKIGVAMSTGLPVVATTLAAEGMLLKNNEHVMIADEPEEFADAIVRLYNNECLWDQLSYNGLKFAENAWGAETAWNILAKILGELDLHVAHHTRPIKLYQYYTADKK